jgi:hypothetical protein
MRRDEAWARRTWRADAAEVRLQVRALGMTAPADREGWRRVFHPCLAVRSALDLARFDVSTRLSGSVLAALRSRTGVRSARH